MKKKIPAVTKVTENPQIFSSPKLTKSLPTIVGPVTVSFKHEDAIDGVAVGPVVVIEQAPYDAWLKKHSIPRIDASGQTRYSPLFGSEPDGKHNLGWVTKPEARKVAAHYGVALKES